MTLSLPLRINLISLVFASLVASVLTALGGVFLYHQQSENAVANAKLAAEQLVLRTRKLLDLELKLNDIIGFDEQCASVIRPDGALRDATLYDAQSRVLARSRLQAPEWPAGLVPPNDEQPVVAEGVAGPVVMHAILHRTASPLGTVVVTVDRQAVLATTLRSVAWLVASALLLFAIGLVIQQGVFWHTIGSPLANLVRTADGIRPDDPATLAPVRQAAAEPDDDIGRLYGAFSRLMQRLLDARAQLVAHNAQLEHMVRERTLELERANAELATDIARRKELEEELRRQASTDALTALANRSFAMPYARRRLEQQRRAGRRFGLMLLDLDGFKAINDRHGHAAGDEVLRAIARRLQAAGREGDVTARLGGDEFLLVLEDFEDITQLGTIAQRRVALFDDPITFGPLRLRVGASVGYATFPEHAGDFDSLLARADEAMYRAKQRGGGVECAVARAEVEGA